jgi:hypothetical protein
LFLCFCAESIGLGASPSCWSKSGLVYRVQPAHSKPRWKHSEQSNTLGRNKICIPDLVESHVKITSFTRNRSHSGKIFLLLFDTFSQLYKLAPNVRMIEWWTDKDMEGNGRDFIPPCNLSASLFGRCRVLMFAWRCSDEGVFCSLLESF